MMTKSKAVSCYDCGLPYGSDGWIEAVIPDKVWNVISPTGDQGGILCITCIAKRIVQCKFETVPVWLCGTEPMRAVPGNPGDCLPLLRTWEPRKK